MTSQKVNLRAWNPSNERLADLTRLPNLDNETGVEHLRNLRDIALRKLDSMSLHASRSYLVAVGLYADRAAEKALA